MHGVGKAPLWQVLAMMSLVVFCYVNLAYFVPRENFMEVLMHYSVLFAGFYFFLNRANFSFAFLAFLALAFRLVFLMASPALSNDFYRFIWDGRLLFEGLNPYLSFPNEFLESAHAGIVYNGEALAAGMGNLNASHYTVYPPINQFCFWLAALFGAKNLMVSTLVLRIIIILADIGIWFFGRRLLRHLKLDEKNIFLYILNPFVVLEFTGNLHFESVMIFFLIWTVYLLLTQRWVPSAVVLAFSICTKLIPLIFLPIFFKKLGWKKAVIYYLTTGTTCLLIFTPFLNQDIVQNLTDSLALYFQNFEFNASIYYIIRTIGFEVTGYNIIATAGKILPVITFIAILTLAFLRKNNRSQTLLKSMLFSVCIYYLLSTTVHPWYVAVPLGLAIFTPFRFPVVWSFMVILSYAAYGNRVYQENLVLIALEYIIVVVYFIYEYRIISRVQNYNFKPEKSYA